MQHTKISIYACRLSITSTVSGKASPLKSLMLGKTSMTPEKEKIEESSGQWKKKTKNLEKKQGRHEMNKLELLLSLFVRETSELRLTR